jgi:catechol 2,3-dioxygenase-like lactoylglutathione lyase family enzyme
MSTETSSQTAAVSDPPKAGEFRLEAVQVPVSDVDRAKEFYAGLGWREDADFDLGSGARIVQFTPPGSGCSVQFGAGLNTMEPGSVQNLEMAVVDIDAAREELLGRGADVSEVFHRDGTVQLDGPDPERESYKSYATFSDPDGNAWVLQEISERLPGR